MLRIKRIYDTPAKTDGMRILVDRLWPRGISKTEASIDVWLKEIAPSPELRRWFGHKPERFKDFSHKYTVELSDNPAVAKLKEIIAQHTRVTLLYGAKDTANNHAVVLQNFLKAKR